MRSKHSYCRTEFHNLYVIGPIGAPACYDFIYFSVCWINFFFRIDAIQIRIHTVALVIRPVSALHNNKNMLRSHWNEGNEWASQTQQEQQQQTPISTNNNVTISNSKSHMVPKYYCKLPGYYFTIGFTWAHNIFMQSNSMISVRYFRISRICFLLFTQNVCCLKAC